MQIIVLEWLNITSGDHIWIKNSIVKVENLCSSINNGGNYCSEGFESSSGVISQKDEFIVQRSGFDLIAQSRYN